MAFEKQGIKPVPYGSYYILKVKQKRVKKLKVKRLGKT